MPRSASKVLPLAASLALVLALWLIEYSEQLPFASRWVNELLAARARSAILEPSMIPESSFSFSEANFMLGWAAGTFVLAVTSAVLALQIPHGERTSLVRASTVTLAALTLLALLSLAPFLAKLFRLGYV